MKSILPLLYLADDGRQFALTSGFYREGLLEVSTEILTPKGDNIFGYENLTTVGTAIAVPAELKADDGRLVELKTWCPRVAAGDFLRVSFTGWLREERP